MAHEIAKLLLEQAETFLDRTKAIETALSLGMPLNEIEEYLDWLDQTLDLRRPPSENADPENPSEDNSQK
jgi:DNA-binding transcriptional MerR regulator